MTSPPDLQLPVTVDGLMPSFDVARWAGLLEQAGLTGQQNPYAAACTLARAGCERILPLAALGIVPWPLIVHQRLLDQVDDHAHLELHLDSRPEAGTVAIVDEPQACDWCALDGRTSPAIVDMPAHPRERRGMWAYHCRDCLNERAGAPVLGVGHGQWLIVEHDLTAQTLTALAAARRFWLGDNTTEPAA